uniref:NACHT domain-containing protein n=1 Tax=Moniliophthora roreri TaxID=221103 RepID=A0A0W0FWB0_MONRR
MFNGSSAFSVTGGEFYNVNGDHYEITNIYAHDFLRGASVLNAAYNSGERVTTAPRCTDGTRKEVIRFIMKWTTNPFTSQRILWLNGLAGEGKSAIAQTVAELCAAPPHKRLAASFFFSGAHAERSSAMQLFPTIAYQLTNYDPWLKIAILDALRKDSSIPDLTPKEQLERLIVEPMMSLGEPSGCPQRIILIEALDECDDYLSVLESLTLILTLRPHLFKLIITSRPESEIQELFSQTMLSGVVQSLSLGQFDARSDIRLYLKKSFNSIRMRSRRRMGSVRASDQWPPRDVIDRLVDESAGLFIYASSIVDFVDHWFESPATRLSMLLDRNLSITPSNHENPYAPLDQLYAHILSTVQEYSSALRTVLGSVMSLFVPLSRQDLSSLISPLLSVDHVNAILEHLYSILKLPFEIDSSQSVQIYHQSLRDYLTDKRRSGDFYVNPSLQHADITWCCFQLMNRMLKRNICKLPLLAKNAEIHDLRNRRNLHIPGALRYACRFWAQHLSMSPFEPKEITRYLEEFVQERFLYWIECLSLLGEMGRALQCLRIFTTNQALIVSFDIRLMVTLILATSSQTVYTVALPSCPSKSPIRRWYSHELPPISDIVTPLSWEQIVDRTVNERVVQHEPRRSVPHRSQAVPCWPAPRRSAPDRSVSHRSAPEAYPESPTVVPQLPQPVVVGFHPPEGWFYQAAMRQLPLQLPVPPIPPPSPTGWLASEAASPPSAALNMYPAYLNTPQLNPTGRTGEVDQVYPYFAPNNPYSSSPYPNPYLYFASNNPYSNIPYPSLNFPLGQTSQ